MNSNFFLRQPFLEVTITPGTAKVRGSNLTGPFFFSNGKYSVSKKCGLFIRLLMFCGLVAHAIIVFFLLYGIYILML